MGKKCVRSVMAVAALAGAMFGGAPRAQAQTESVLVNFTGSTGAAPGANPQYGNLIQASDGNFYGLTFQGGANNVGAAFKMTPVGVVTLLHSFAGGTSDGQTPYGSLVEGTDGNFYGLTLYGGANSDGTAFKMTPAGAVTLLHSFFSASDGHCYYPYGSLVQGTDGNFYGLTYGGGTNNFGGAFQMTPAGAVTLLHSFAGTADGAFPYGSLVQGTDGNFYGLTEAGGAHSDGAAFKMTPGGAVTLLHSFAGAADGKNPYGSLVQGTDGNFYGMTNGGGVSSDGTAFKITPGGTFSLLHSFAAGTADGLNPYGSLMQGTDGNFYGLTYAGGASSDGILFNMTSGGTVTLLHSFAGGTADGLNPYGSLVQGTDGNFYGMTIGGGVSSAGVIFKQTTGSTLAAPVTLSSTATTVAPGGAFTLTYSVANAYTGATNGTNAGSGSLGYCFASNTASNATWTGVITGSATAANSPSLTAPSTAGTYTYSLTCGGMESNLVTITVPTVPAVTGVAPTSGAVSGGTSVIITGTNFTGATAVKFGTANATSFTVNSATQITAVSPAVAAGAVDVTVTTTGGTSATGSSDQFTYLRATVTFGVMSFSPAATEPFGTSQAITISEAVTYGGAQPTGAVTFVLNSVSYTATCTTAGSPETCTATVPATTIAALASASYIVTAALAQDSAYNAGSGTSGTFNITPPYFVLANFTGTSGAAPGATPYYGNLIQASDGNFYGLTNQGGANNDGAAFKMTPTGAVTLLHSFAGGAADGEYPDGSLVQGTDGNFYGLTQGGGGNNDGVAFQMTPAGAVTLLHSFAGGTADGVNPNGSLVQGTDGNFYGLTYGGGASNYGVAFKMTLAGAVTLQHSFAGTADGKNPYGSLVQGMDGNFYGLTEAGGANNDGAAFKMTPAGTVTLLYSFAGTADGANPYTSLVQGTDGNFYGLTEIGGASNYGAAFKMTPTGTVTLLHSFAGAPDGKNPYGSLVQGTDGNFYGFTNGGGSSSDGVIFKQTTATTLAAPVALSSTATTVYTGGAFTLTYSVANAYTGATNGTNAGSSSLGYCFASNTASNATWTGVKTGSATAASSPSLTAPSTAGTYTFSLTCGGMESNLVTLTVQATTPPVLTLPSNKTVEATSAAGAVATYTATATDAQDGTDPVVCSPASGSTFAFGTTQVNCSATDSYGNHSSGSFNVTVQDTTAPVITVPANKTVAAMSAAGAVVTFTATATDAVDGTDSVTCAPVSGSTFALGTTQVTCSATDAHSNSSSASFTVKVVRQSVFITNSGGSVTSKYDSGGSQSAATTGGGIGAAVDAAGYVWSINANGSSVSVFTDAGALSTSYSSGGISGAKALAIDGNNITWIANGNGTITALTNAGVAVGSTPIDPMNGTAAPASISVDTDGSLWLAVPNTTTPSSSTVIEVIGGAGPISTPTVTQVINSSTGTKP